MPIAPPNVWRMFNLPDPDEDRPLRAPRPPSPIEPLGPDEEESVLAQLGGGALTGLAWLGNVLDTPGSVVRGLVAGEPGRAFRGVLDPAQRVHGRELLRQPEGTPFFSGEGLGAFATEVALDPLTYLTFGGSALTKAGQVARKAGTLARGARAQIGAGQRGLVGIGLPFLDPVAAVGTGQAGLNTLDTLGAVARPVARFTGLEALGRAAAPAGRRLRALFDPAVQGTVTPEGQAAARSAYEMLQSGLPQARQKQLDLLRMMEAGGVSSDDLIRYVEGRVAPGQASPELQQVGNWVKNELDRMLQTEQQLGSGIAGRAAYFPRYQTPLETQTKGFRAADRGLSAFHPSQIGREEILEIPGGRSAVNDLVKDRQVRALLGAGSQMQARQALAQLGQPLPAGLANLPPNKLSAADLITRRYLGFDPTRARAQVSQLKALRKRQGFLSPADQAQLDQLKGSLVATHKQAKGLADWVQKNVDPRHADQQLDFFGNHAAEDFLRRATYHERAKANLEAVHGMLTRAAVPAAQATPEMMSLDTAFARLTGHGGVPNAAAKQALAGRLAAAGQAGTGAQMFVDPRVVEDAARYGRAWSEPDAVRGFVEGWRSVSNFGKTALTTLWPAFHTRNAVTGGFMNWVAGAFHPQAYQGALAMRRGGVIDWASQVPGLQHLPADQATRQLAEEAYAHGLLGAAEGPFADLTGVGAHVAQRSAPTLYGPGHRHAGALEAFAGGYGDLLRGKDWDPRRMAGVGGQRVDRFAPSRGGREASRAVDEVNRFAGFLELRRQGWSAEAAARKMMEVHYDYSKLAGFEKAVAREVMPFYNFMRHNVPFVLKELMERPGGRMATAVKAGAEARGEQPGFLPEWLGKGLALPLGENPDGSTRFLTGLGLPFEDVAGQLSLQGLAGQLNPLIKLPIELTTGRQLYSGRELEDLHGLTGDPTVDNILYNSPVSRFLTSGRTLLDERKGVGEKAVNLLTGARVSDVDLEKARDLRVRDLIEENLRGRPNVHQFTRNYVSEEDLPNLSAYDLLLLRLNRTREQRARGQ